MMSFQATPTISQQTSQSQPDLVIQHVRFFAIQRTRLLEGIESLAATEFDKPRAKNRWNIAIDLQDLVES